MLPPIEKPATATQLRLRALIQQNGLDRETIDQARALLDAGETVRAQGLILDAHQRARDARRRLDG